jgi:uncharacterized membrane protein
MADGSTPESTGLRGPWVYNLAFIIVAFITVVSFVLGAAVFPFTMAAPITQPEQIALTICDVGLKAGLGAIGGLLTGKTTA